MKQALKDALQERGYETLTPVQEAVSQAEVDGRDMLVSAQTGSGKTVGFGLAIAGALLGDAEQFGKAGAPLALIIAPTRELALQVRHELGWLYAKAGAFIASTVGGMDMRNERRALERGAHIVVATPGRLRDHITRGSIDLSEIRAVVLDEADEMLDLGFREDLEFILSEAPEARQTLLFSATVPPAIGKLAQSYQRDALRIETRAEERQHADIEYKALNVAQRDAENAIINVLRYFEAPNAIIFGNTRAIVNRLTTRLSNRGFAVVSLSGELSQTERSHALQAMRDGRARVCVATDVAARGIDLPGLDLVIHAELPTNQETLLHRSGRTGRAGRKGVSALIVPPKARKKAERLLKWAKLTATWEDAPSAEAVRARDAERMLADPSWLEPIGETEQELVNTLKNAFSHEQMAAAYLRLYEAKYSAPEELLPSGQSAPEPRKPFGPSVWFSIEGGAKAGAEPRRLLPAICAAGGITKDAIGAIRIGAGESYFELKAEEAEVFEKIAEGEVEGKALTRLAEAPDQSQFTKPQSRKPAFGKGRREDAERKPYGKPKGRADGPREKKPWGEKPRERKPREDKPKRPEETRPKGAVKPLGGSAKPAPKKEEKPAFSKPKTKRGASDPSARMDGRPKGRKGAAPKDGAAKKPRWKDGGGKSAPKGKAPPVGKPNSKKNKARRAAAAAAGATGKGGAAKPKRK